METAKHEVKVNYKVQSDCAVLWSEVTIAIIIITHNPGVSLLQNRRLGACPTSGERKNKKENKIKEIQGGGRS